MTDFEECAPCNSIIRPTETLVKEEDQARSTPDTPHYTFDMRRISIKTSPELSKTSEGHAPHTRSSYATSKAVYEYSRIY